MDEDRRRVLSEYKKVRKKYGLDDLEVLEKEFQFYVHVPTDYVQEVLSSLLRWISNIRGTLNSLIIPQTYLSQYEAKFLSKKERDLAFEHIKQLVAFDWDYINACTIGDEAKVELIKRIVEYYRSELKQYINKLSAKLSKEWLKKNKKEKDTHYIS